MAIKKTQRGFTLLIAVIFMSVMLAFGLALSSIAYKQQVLASSAVESQYAFYAADAGLECALYFDQTQNLFVYPQADPKSPPTGFLCDGGAPYSSSEVSYTSSQWVLTYRFTLDSTTANPRCVDVTVYKPNSSGTNYIFSQGYDVPCATVAAPQSGARIVSRGINIQY